MRMKIKRRTISAIDFVYTSANHRSEPKFGQRVSHSAARIQMMSHQMSKPCENHSQFTPLIYFQHIERYWNKIRTIWTFFS